MKKRKPEVYHMLLLCNRPVRGADASTVTDHIDSFLNYSNNKILPLSFVRAIPSSLCLERFDSIIIHYSIAIGYLRDHYINCTSRSRIRKFNGLKIAFIQDEYRAVNSVLDSLRFMKIHLLFTCVPKAEIEMVYPTNKLPGVKKINTLTGFVPESLTQVDRSPIQNRPIHVGYRSRKPPFWLGQLAFEKHEIASSFLAKTQGTGLRVDISCHEADRIYGKAWIRFVSSCKTMLGVESGSSVFDFRGKIQKKVESYMQKNPQASFKNVQEKFLKPHENKIRLNQISPRCFEAAALGTAMILYEGKYSGILKPGRHFISLKKDFSNITKVVKILKHDSFLQKIADQAFSEVACNPRYSYRNFIRKFDLIVKKEFKMRGLLKSPKPYSRQAFCAALLKSPGYCLHQIISRNLQRVLLGTFLRKGVFRFWNQIPLRRKTILRHFLRVIGR